MKRIVVLGSTGSIGTQTLDVVRALPEHFEVVGLAAGKNLDLLAQQVREFHPRMVWADVERGEGLQQTLNGSALVSMEDMAAESDVDLVMAATTGRAGLASTLRALEKGKAVALSNKEVIVMAGRLVTGAAARHAATLLPVDSEPSAIWQCLRGEPQPVERLIITASGGPFRTRPIGEVADVTPEEALAHPTWVMGPKITIDSATLMNKGFEVIESRWLFDVPYERIEVVVHPQSVVHSMVEFADGSVKAQMGPPDMRLPIQYALAYPERLPHSVGPRYSPLRYPSLTFETLDTERYPCFKTALGAAAMGRTCPAVLSAADEEAVRLFLERKISFGSIHSLVQRVLDRHEPWEDDSVEAVLAADEWARQETAKAASRL